MILEHGMDDTSARWNGQENKWDVGQRKKYRWCYVDNTPASEWYYELQDALNWIIDYDTKKFTIS